MMSINNNGVKAALPPKFILRMEEMLGKEAEGTEDAAAIHAGQGGFDVDEGEGGVTLADVLPDEVADGGGADAVVEEVLFDVGGHGRGLLDGDFEGERLGRWRSIGNGGGEGGEAGLEEGTEGGPGVIGAGDGTERGVEEDLVLVEQELDEEGRGVAGGFGTGGAIEDELEVGGHGREGVFLP